jgi:hypothetical protein
MRRMLLAIVAATVPCLASGETKFTFQEYRDKLSNQMTRRLVVTGEDGKSTIELRQTDGDDKLMVFIDPAGVIFPDIVEDLQMAVSVTLRSSEMEKPVTVRCGMHTMEYDFCYFGVRPKPARKLFSGEQVTIKMARTAETVTFPLGGAEYEEALGKVLAPFEKDGQ